MNAKEARALTEKSLKEVCIKPAMEYVFNRIAEEAKDGKTELYNPLLGFKDSEVFKPINDTLEKAVYRELKELGYKVKYHDYSRSQDPREHSYYSISW